MAIAILRRRPPSELLPSKAALDLIRHFEGLSLTGYGDVIGVATVGYGHTGPDVVIGKQITLAEADALLEADVAKHAQIVRDSVQVQLTQSEFDALCSLAFNLGYIPRSMKAALNGGVTDKGKVLDPGSYGSALLEFPRNCRAGGKPLKGLYRRRLAEACVFNDLPWENACSISVIKFGTLPNGEIDPNATTTLEDTLMRARLDTSRVPDTSATLTKPWSELVPPPKPEASVTIIEDKDELVLTTPAAPVSVPAPAAGQPAEPPSPPPAAPAPVKEQAKTSPDAAVASKISPNVDTKPATATVSGPPVAGPVAGGPSTAAPQPNRPPPVPVAPPPPPVKAAPPPEPPSPPVPIGQQTSAVDAARKSEEWSSSAKSMIYSRRFWGLFLVVVGRVWMLKTGSNAVLGAVSDPLVMEMFSGFMVMVIGEAVQHWGERKATRPLK